MTGFDTRWLDLREPADRAARDDGLKQHAIAHLASAGSSACVVDLGTGTGSTYRALLPAAAEWRWRLVDNDLALLAEVKRRHDDRSVIDCVSADLADLSADVFGGAGLVTASALFDLVSESFLERLAGLLAERHAALYSALNYDGHCRWDVPLAADAEIVSAFNTHQRRDKGFGPALGPSAGTVLRRILVTAGFEVTVAPSPWRLGPAHVELQRHFIDGMALAAGETGSVRAPVIEDWRAARIDLIATSRATIGHWDLLATR